MRVLDNNISVFKFFEEISNIPRASFHEELISNYLENFAINRNLKYYRDNMNNIIIFKEGSKGYENHEPLMLQGHMDMVAEKTVDSHHDFDKDPLDLYVKDGILKAKNTTLGADDGCGVAIMLALLDDKDAKHPPLECVFTVQEEVGLLGAYALDMSKLISRRMISLDSENELETMVSTAGGQNVTLTKNIKYKENSSPVYSLSISGLKGGHSGAEIDKERANAIILIVKFMRMLIKENINVRIVSINGGSKENAIPINAKCEFASSNSINEIELIITKVFKSIKEQYHKQEPKLTIELKEGKSDKVLDIEDSNAIINTIYLSPNGMIAMSKDIDDLTLISLNCGVIKTINNQIIITYSLRSPIVGALHELTDKINIISNIYGFNIKVSNIYGGWNYNPKSVLRKQFFTFFKKEYDIDISPIAVHGGLEVGIFNARIPNLDIITYGPNMEGIHSPDERLDLESFKRVYFRLKAFIETL